MGDRLTDARNSLYAQLVPLLDAGRVSAYPPASVVAPCYWIETATGGQQTAGSATYFVATFPVVAVVDGDVKIQSLTLDEMIARAVDALRKAKTADVLSWQASSLDVGGPTLRAATIQVAVGLVARTLCDPPLTT